MNRILHTALLAAAALCSVAAAGPADVEIGALGQRERLLTQFEQLPMPRLEAVFIACDRASSKRMMGADEGAMCAMAWDALLERGYSGDVRALLAWWRNERARSAAHD